MAIPLKQSTASQEVLLPRFLDSVDGNTQETALSIANTDIKIWKMGAITVANKNSGGATHISNGLYYCVLDATDTDTLGALVVEVHFTGALAVRLECVVLPSAVYDALIGGTGNGVRADVQALAAGSVTAAAIATGAIDADALAADAGTEIATAVWASGTRTLTGLASGIIAAAELNNIADALLKRDLSAVSGEASRSVLNAVRFLRNRWAISGGTLTVRKEDDTTSAWTATVTQTAGNPVSEIDPA